MRAVKVYAVPGDPESAADSWAKCGFTWVMAGTACLDSPLAGRFLAAIRACGLKWSAIEPVFLAGDDCAERDLSVGNDGRALVDDWVRFWCPSKAAQLERVTERIRAYAALSPDGMSLDFIRFWQFWETVPPDADPDSLRSACHCPECSRLMSAEGETAFRCRVVTDTVRSLSGLARALLPNVRLGLHTVPWLEGEFGGAVKRLLGQDIEALAPFADYLSPMVYHQMAGRDTAWIARVVAEQSERTRVPVVPSVQTAPVYNARPLDAREFGEAAETALRAPSAGIAVYRHEDLAAEPDKARLLSRLFAR